MLRTRLLAAGLLAGLTALAGCTGAKTETARPQANDDFADKLAAAKVGDKTVVSNTEPIAVSAVGLVWKLPGTGSAASGEWRPLLEREFRKKKLPNPKQFLDDPNKTCSMVLVSAVIPPGARKGDSVDIDVVLPRASQTTSLKGGVLFECELFTSENSSAVRDAMIAGGAKPGQDIARTPVASNTLLVGKTLVRAEGPLVVGSTGETAKVKAVVEEDAPTATPGYTAGRVWGGGKVLEDRPYWLVMNDPSARLSMEIAARLNATFQPGGDTRTKVANAVTKEVVLVLVPPAYRLNHARFLIVARQVPMLPTGPDSLYRKKLETELLEPETAIAAALKLEALGGESTQPLRVGLQSPSPWVRFAAAESLAYLGNTTAAAELARLAEAHPALRSHCLLALATLDDGVSSDRLVELMAHPDAGVRYGAFTALRSGNDQHPMLAGKHVHKSFWLHQVAAESTPLVHLSSKSRAEIVLFGKVGALLPPFSFPLGSDFTITAKASDTEATIAHIVPGSDGPQEVKATCPLNLASLLTAIGEMGGGYSEAIELIRRADTAKVLPATVTLDATPRGLPLTQLATLARNDATLERANLDVERVARGEIVQAGYDLPSGEAVKAPPPAPVAAPLSRNPGRIFGPKKHPMDPDENPNPTPTPPVVETAPNRTQGRLFGK